MTDVVEMSPRDKLRVVDYIERHPCVQEMVARDVATQHLFELAAAQHCGFARWRMYEILKRVGQHYVGWNARNPVLRQSRFYEAYATALDMLLPDEGEMIGDEKYQTQIEAVQPLRPIIASLFPDAPMPLFLFGEQEQEPSLVWFLDDEKTA